MTQWTLTNKDFLSNAGKVFDSGNDETEQIEHLKKENEGLVQQIGQLTVDAKISLAEHPYKRLVRRWDTNL